MFCTRFFADCMFAPRFFPKIGVTIVFNPYWAANSNTFINAIYPAVVPK